MDIFKSGLEFVNIVEKFRIMIFQDRYFFHATSRAYASTYARWANVTEWLGASNWDYRQFYYAQGFTSESYEWLQTLYRVIKDREVRID